MRRPSTAILAFILVTTIAQQPGGGASRGGRRSGPPTLTNPNPFTHPYWRFPPRFGTGSNGLWTSGHGWRQPGFFPDPLILNRNGWPPFDEYGFYNTPAPGYPIGPYWPDYYTQPNVPVLPPPPAEQPGPMGGETVPEATESPTPETTGIPVYRGPASPTNSTDEHPPLIALKNRWAYTALKYWVNGKTFHFITTQGDHMQVSTNMVDRIYPTPTRALKTEPRPESEH